MTIFTTSLSYQGYPLQAIEKAVSEPLVRLSSSGPQWRRLNSALIRLECYLEVTDQTLVKQDLFSKSGSKKLHEFTAALYSSKFDASISQPWAIARVLKNALQTEFPNSRPVEKFPCTPSRENWPLDFIDLVEEFSSRELNFERISFWQGWTIRNINGKEQHLRLWPIYQRYGPECAAQIYEACNTWYRGRRAAHIPVVQEFIDYLANKEQKIDVMSPTSLGLIFGDFFTAFFSKRHTSGLSLAIATREWHKFVSLICEHLLGKSWANPLPVVPHPQTRRLSGAKSQVRTTPEGYSTKHSLITPIPLHLSDSEAKEILFRTIRKEHDDLLKWARSEAEQARERLARRKLLAPKGIISLKSTTGANNGIRFRTSRECEDHLAHAAATFEASGFNYVGSGRANLHYPRPLDQTAFELGLPLPQLLLAHATILVANHPSITPSFLESLYLFDKNGSRTGLIETDAGAYLRGFKMRKGANRAQQDVLLNTETRQVINDVILMTEPLREWLRNKGSDSWRRLFLATTSMGNAPLEWKPTHEASRQTAWLASRFTEILGIRDDTSKDLAERFSLKRFRSSAGVLVYIETGSVEQMAKALGHTQYSPRLLDHYLPRPIQEFFVERWIRLFQTGIICEALKSSPYLLEASSFTSMQELDEFLENHALRRIPAHLENPDAIGGAPHDPEPSSVAFGIETGILTILISLERAVRKAQSTPCGRATRWASIAERLIPYLEVQTEQPEFAAMVARARKHADPAMVEGLIYG